MSVLSNIRAKAAGVLAPVSARVYGWAHTILESFTGAWQRNVEVKRDHVLAYWAVWACIKLISGDISKMRLKLVEQGSNGLWTEIKAQSPFLPVLRKPNHYQTRLQFYAYWVISLLAHGNTYVLKRRDQRGIVTAMYVLDPCGVTVLVGEDGSVFYQLRRDNLAGRGELLDVTVPASEIIHDRIMCLFHPLVGISPLFASGVAASQGLEIQRNSWNFFKNGAMPGGIIKVPGALDKEKAGEIKAKWDTNYSGSNRGKVAVLADRMEYQPLTMNAVDSQTVEQLKMTAEMVCSTFGVPAYKIGAGPMPAYNNIAALDQQYYSQCLQTIIEGMEAVLDEGLGLTEISGRTVGVEFDLKALIRMDPAAQMDYTDKGIRAGVIAPNEGRAEFDMQPVPGGDMPLLQQQMWPIDTLADRPPPSDGAAAAATDAPADEPETPIDPPEKAFNVVDFRRALEMRRRTHEQRKAA